MTDIFKQIDRYENDRVQNNRYKILAKTVILNMNNGHFGIKYGPYYMGHFAII